MTTRTYDGHGITDRRSASDDLDLGTVVASLFAAARRAAERSRSRRALAAMDDRMLADIGLDREQALAEAAKPFWRA